MPGAVERAAGVVDVHALEGGGEAVRVALAAGLAVGDDVEARRLLRADGEHRGIVLSLFQKILVDAPELSGAHARREAPGELLAVDQPLGLRIASGQGSRKKHLTF